MAAAKARYVPRIWLVRAPTAFIAPICRICAVSKPPSMVATRIDDSSRAIAPNARSTNPTMAICPWWG